MHKIIKVQNFTYPLLAAAFSLSFSACSDDSENPSNGDSDGGSDASTFTIPTYADDYSAISGWDYRKQWNLANVHDPSVVYWTDGYYYEWGTDASYGNAHDGHGHFLGKRSKDLVNWQVVPGIFTTPPDWVTTKINEILTAAGKDNVTSSQIDLSYWAPVVRKITVDGQTKLRMYYSMPVNKPTLGGNQGIPALIGMCESTDPDNGVWEDKGFVTCSSSDMDLTTANLNNSQWGGFFYYNGIDPTYIVTPEGQHWLIHGSWHSGFAALQLNPSTGMPVKNTTGNPWTADGEDHQGNFGVNISTRSLNNRWQASEGPEVIYHDGYYYLFMAYDELAVAYNTRVVRSESITGPYYDITGRNHTNGRGDAYPIVTHPYKFKGHTGWVGISHCAIFPKKGDENATEWFYMSQGRLPANAGGNANANAIMMGHVRRLVWAPASASDLTNKWPIALPERYAAVPDYGTLTQDSLVGKWEHINLEYHYQVQDESSYINLNADGTVTDASGAATLGGSWSYDATNKLLIIGDAAVCVEREVDWEASPRCVTLVYAGIGQDGKTTWWGKKVKE